MGCGLVDREKDLTQFGPASQDRERRQCVSEPSIYLFGPPLDLKKL